MIEQFKQDLAPSRHAAARNLANHAILRGPRKVLDSSRQINHDRLRIELAQQAGHFHGFRDGPAANRAAQVLQGFFPEIAGQIGYVLGIVAQAAAIEARRQLFHRRLRQEFQNIRQSGRDVPRPQGFIHKIRHAVFDAHLRAQAARDSRPLGLHSRHQIKRLLHRREVPAGRGLLAQAHKRRTD